MNKSLYVGNLAYSATEATLSQAFAPYRVSRVRMMEGRGFAFIDLPADQVDPAIAAMHGKSIEGRNLNVSEARPKSFEADRPTVPAGRLRW